MDAATMTQAAIVLFAIAALGGLVMAIQVFRGRDRPSSLLAMGHGFLGAVGLTLLIWAAVMAGVPTLVSTGLVVLVLAALGGVTMALKFHMKMLPLPKPMVLGHGALAVVGFVLVLLGSRG